MADQGRLDELKRKFDENPRRYFAPLANEYRKAGDPERAIELCRTYLPQQPAHMSGYIVYGQALHDAGQADESAAVFKQALTLDPENIIALRHLGDISRDAGDNAGAMRWYGKVLELDPRNDEIAAYIASLGQPGGSDAPRARSERPVPPTVRPEPAHDASAVRLEDIVSEPDLPQPSPAGSDNRGQDAASVIDWPDELYPDESAPPATHAADSPFVTETMAELYLQQGLHGEALLIYRQLALKRDDPELRQRIADLESSQTPDGARETVRAFFARIGKARPSERVHMASQSRSSLSALFGAAQPSADDLMAAQRLSGAFGDTRSRGSHS